MNENNNNKTWFTFIAVFFAFIVLLDYCSEDDKKTKQPQTTPSSNPQPTPNAPSTPNALYPIMPVFVQPSYSNGGSMNDGIECVDCYGAKRCTWCAGNGGRIVDNPYGMGTIYVPCSHCNGTGTCPTCHGRGRLYN